MNPVELRLPDGTLSGVFMCSACHRLDNQKLFASRCCLCSVCGKVKDWTTSNLDCDACRTARWAKADREKMDRAEKLEGWDGWVYTGGTGGHDGYFESLDHYVEYLDDQEIESADRPEFVWIAEPVSFPELDVERILENLLDDWDSDDFTSHLEGVAELTAAIDAFNAANAHHVSYYAHEKKAVRVPGPTPEASPEAIAEESR